MLSSARHPHLDGLRGLAIIAVVIWHYFASFLGYEHVNSNGELPYGPLAFAWAGVDVFFVLSGYLITEILHKAAGATNYFRVFFFRRACRLLPLYALTLLSYYFGRWYFMADVRMSIHFHKSGIPDWAWLLGLQNVLMAWKHSFGPAWLSVTWSLAVEMQFYLVWAMALRWLSSRGIWVISVVGILAAPVIRWQCESLTGYVSLITRCDSFLGGAMVARVATLAGPTFYLRWRNVIWSSLAVCLLLQGIMIYDPRSFGTRVPWYSVGSSSLIMLTTSLLLFITNHEPKNWLTRGISVPWLVKIGIVAYGIYLGHQPIRIIIQYLCGFTGSIAVDLTTWSLMMFLSAISTFILATILHYTLERPFIAIGRQWNYQMN